MFKSLSLIVLLTSALLAACAYQQPNESNNVITTNLPVISVEATDTNNDGNINIEEFNSRLETLFVKRDVNEDGLVTQSELPQVNIEAYNEADRDNDKALTAKEYQQLRMMDFRRIDQNSDEILVPHEILSW